MSGRKEMPDPTPIAIPVRRALPGSIDEMRRAIREEMSRAAMNAGHETFEEANDFDVPDADELEPRSPHEYTEMQEEYLTKSVEEAKMHSTRKSRDTRDDDDEVPTRDERDRNIKSSKLRRRRSEERQYDDESDSDSEVEESPRRAPKRAQGAEDEID